MGNVINFLSNLGNNFLGSSRAGVTGAPSSFPPKRTPIELSNDQDPLESLNRDPFSGRFLSYPSDLINDVSYGHYIIFFMNQQVRTRFPYVNKDGKNITAKTIETVSEDTRGAAGQVVRRKGEECIRQGSVDEDIDRGFESDFFTNINSDTTLLKPQETGFSTGALAEMQTTERTQDSIAIYLPPNVQNNYTTSYNAMPTGLLGFYGSVRHRFC